MCFRAAARSSSSFSPVTTTPSSHVICLGIAVLLRVPSTPPVGHVRYRRFVAVGSREVGGTTTKRRRWSWGRVVLLVACAICFYVFAPSLAEVFEAWDRLGEVHPFAVVLIFVAQTASFLCVWEV